MKEEIVLKAEKREIGKKSSVKKLRREGKVPAIIYGGDKEPVPVSVGLSDFLHLAHKYHLASHIISVQYNGVKENVLVKDIQFHPVKDTISHIDFIRITPKREIEVEVPLEFIGESPGEKKGGILDFVLRTLRIRTVPGKLPEKITLDISSLDMGGVILVKDLKLPEGVKPLIDEDAVVITVLSPKEEEVEEVAPEEAEPEVIKKGKEEEEKKEGEEKGE